MASILLLTHSLNCSQEEFNESLKEYVNSKTNLGRWPCLIPELDATIIKQCVISPNHLAFLTHDGRVCRIPYQIDSEALSYSSPKHSSEEETPHPPASKKTPTSSGGPSGRGSGATTSSNSSSNTTQPTTSGDAQNEHTFSLSSESLSGQLGRWAHRVVNASSATSTSGTTSVSNPLNMRATTRGRARILRAARGRVGSGWLSGRAIIPASAVPDELISQAQVVLQGKSRQAIIRELQKTSLDVNLAVNNLLSRDDDDPEEPDDESYMQESYFPGEDLMSIFETGIPNDEQFVVQRDAIFPEDIIYNPSYSRSDENRSSSNRANNQGASSSSAGNRDEHSREFSSSCVRDRWWGMLLDRSEKSPSGSSSKLSKLKDKAAVAASSTQKFGDVQWWHTTEPDSGHGRKVFTDIVSLHSELIAVTSDGYIQQWLWEESFPFSQNNDGGHNHKRAVDMNLTNDDKVTKIAAQNIRVSILTESGKIATWLDDTLAAVGHKLEHPLQTFSELKGLPVTQLQVCDLYSCVQLSNGSIYWWGVFPFEQRRKILDKVKTKAKKSAIAGSNQIKSGTLVCIRSCPLYYPGAIGFTTVNGEPKVGELLDKAWSITEKCRFKILEKEPEVKTENQKPKLNEENKDEKHADDEMKEETEKEEPVVVIGKKRKHSSIEDREKSVSWKEEEWCLQDVIFVEDIRHVPVGEVLKVDGAYAMVHFSSKLLGSSNSAQGKDALGSSSLGVDTMLKESVIRRKDELQIVKWTTPPKMPECYQKVPKQLNISGNSKILTMALGKKGVHALIKSSNGLRYSMYSLASSRPDPGGVIQTEPACFLSQTSPNIVRLFPSGTKSNVLLKDPNNCLYPLVKDNLGGMQSPVWANLSSVNCIATGRKRVLHSTKGKSQLAVTLIVMNENYFLQAVLRSDVDTLSQILVNKSKENIEELVSSKCDGNRNVLHLCVNMCQPQSSKPSSSSSTSKTLDPSAFFANASGVDDGKDESYEPSLWIPLFDSMACLELILNSAVLSEHMLRLLSEKDAFGYTPFMIAVRVRAYPAAVKLYNTAVKVSTNTDTGVQNKEQFMSMIYPSGSDPDMSPLHMLCCNDTCSFTWTGMKHINQDIFECKTCGLVGPLCCCTECAQVCHIGHECKLKRTSPTAYCDCWEKCPCKALVSGEQDKRKELLYKLVEETDLSTKPNNNGQHILLFLAQTVSRQAVEQEQYVPNRMNDSDSSKQRARLNNSERRGKVSNQVPPFEHEQEPPKFSKLSLTYILKNWTALKSMMMFGCKQTGSRRAKALDDNLINSTLLQTEEIGNHLDGQNGTAFLDNFVHKLIVKCNGEYLEVLLQTLLYRLQEDLADEEYTEILVASKRFIRSVIRVYVVLAACTGTNSTKKKSISASLMKCKHVFQSLNVLVAQEMADIASSVFAPVRMGVVYPSAPFTLGSAPDSTQTSEELFSAPPLPERFSGMSSSSSSSGSQSRVRFAEEPSVEALEETQNDEEEMDTEPTVSQSQASSTAEESHEESTVQESDVDIDLMAESDSDSEESNNGDATDNANTTSGSESLRRGHTRRGDGYYSTTEASETEGEEDEDGEDEEEEEEEDDEDDDEMENQNDGSEQRNNAGGESNTAPHALQWAVRNTQNNSSTSSSSTAAAHVSGSGLVFIDTSLLRRSGASASTDGNASSTMYCTPSALARTFSLLIREISDLLNTSNSGNNVCLPLAKVTVTDAREVVDKYLCATWEWLWRVMEETEAKLRFGASLTAVSDPGHPQHPLYESQSKLKTNRSNTLSGNPIRTIPEGRRKKRSGGTALTGSAFDSPSARHEYLSYILSLMRSHNDEHADLLPKLEITSLRHVAYVLDSFIYYLRAKQQSVDSLDTKLFSLSSQMEEESSSSSSGTKKNEHNQTAKTTKPECEDELTEDEESEVNDVEESSNDADLKLANHRFFKRSDSTLVLGYEPTDPFTAPLKEALPLADRPHLLNPSARRDQLFGVQKHPDSSTTIEAPLTMKLNAGLTSSESNKHLNLSANAYLGRWHMCLELFGRVFIDDVGTEPNSVLNELGRFDVKEVKFRREMEKLRNAHQKDLYLEGLDRSRPLLLQQALRQLNSQFGRRLSGATPLSVHRLKVSFKDEPGEGSGVVRSFYTAISNAFLADEKLPNLDAVSSSSRGGLSHQIRARAKERDRDRDRRRSSGNNLPSGMVPRIVRRNERVTERTAAELENCQLSLDAPVYYYNSDVEENNQNQEDYVESGIPIHKRELARRIYKKVFAINAEHTGKITGMLLELTPTQIIYLLSRDQAFKEKVNEALDLINGQSSSRANRDDATSGASSSSARTINDASLFDADEEDECLDNSPLFFQPGKPGYYSPRPGRNGPDRLDCLRNVGRIVGLCLLQNELCPLAFNRHVIKYLLGRPISWHDLAFYDPTLYESLRQLIEDSKRPDSTEFFSSLDLTFYIQLRAEEGGGGVDLVTGGSQVEVAPDNVLEYVKRYAEYRMITNSIRALQAMRRGLLDVVPPAHLEGLTAEDFRLLLNGAGDISVQQLMSYTFFSDETGGEVQDKLAKFKKWFWAVVENMTAKQKQDLLYFWTSSPAMPASAEGFQPMPSVTVKPANDHQLPTANTCISRLYVPLYSSKAILRSKFLLAIKTKVFGFV